MPSICLCEDRFKNRCKCLELRSTATRTEILPTEKDMTCADAVGNHISEQGFILWQENQMQCIQCSKSQPTRELKQDHQRTCPGIQKFGM